MFQFGGCFTSDKCFKAFITHIYTFTTSPTFFGNECHYDEITFGLLEHDDQGFILTEFLY
jgi:hypothetical protein